MLITNKRYIAALIIIKLRRLYNLKGEFLKGPIMNDIWGKTEGRNIIRSDIISLRVGCQPASGKRARLLLRRYSLRH